MLGVEDGEVATGGWRIYKANVSIFRGRKNTRAEDDDVDEGPWEAYPVETIVAAQLLELIEREGMRRFIVHCSDSDDDSGSLVSNTSCYCYMFLFIHIPVYLIFKETELSKDSWKTNYTTSSRSGSSTPISATRVHTPSKPSQIMVLALLRGP